MYKVQKLTKHEMTCNGVLFSITYTFSSNLMLHFKLRLYQTMIFLKSFIHFFDFKHENGFCTENRNKHDFLSYSIRLLKYLSFLWHSKYFKNAYGYNVCRSLPSYNFQIRAYCLKKMKTIFSPIFIFILYLILSLFFKFPFGFMHWYK